MEGNFLSRSNVRTGQFLQERKLTIGLQYYSNKISSTIPLKFSMTILCSNCAQFITAKEPVKSWRQVKPQIQNQNSTSTKVNLWEPQKKFKSQGWADSDNKKHTTSFPAKTKLSERLLWAMTIWKDKILLEALNAQTYPSSQTGTLKDHWLWRISMQSLKIFTAFWTEMTLLFVNFFPKNNPESGTQPPEIGVIHGIR